MHFLLLNETTAGDSVMTRDMWDEFRYMLMSRDTTATEHSPHDITQLSQSFHPHVYPLRYSTDTWNHAVIYVRQAMQLLHCCHNPNYISRNILDCNQLNWTTGCHLKFCRTWAGRHQVTSSITWPLDSPCGLPYTSILHSNGDMEPQRFWGHYPDPLGSRNIIGHVISRHVGFQ